VPLTSHRSTVLVAALSALTLGLTGAACTSSDDGAAPEPERLTATTGVERSTTTTTDSSSSSASDEDRPACELVTEADATEAFGEPAVNSEDSTDECWWSTDDDLKTINVIRRRDDVEEWRSGYQNDHWEPNDLGDEGYTGLTLDSVVFRVGEVQYEVNVIYSTAGDPEQVAADLGELVASRV
jgi:hypothetical protein